MIENARKWKKNRAQKDLIVLPPQNLHAFTLLLIAFCSAHLQCAAVPADLHAALGTTCCTAPGSHTNTALNFNSGPRSLKAEENEVQGKDLSRTVPGQVQEQEENNYVRLQWLSLILLTTMHCSHPSQSTIFRSFLNVLGLG